MSNFDFKKAYKDLYLPSQKPHLIEVPEMKYIAVFGKGDPNEEGGAYAQALQLLYGLSFTIKMSERTGREVSGYFPYVVPPLEGIWWSDDASFDISNIKGQKEKLSFLSMIAQPDFVDEATFAWACEQVTRKKGLDCTSAQLLTITEGWCVQMMHIGPYDDESISFQKMDAFVAEQGLRYENHNLPSLIQKPAHHEIYLGDPRKCKPERLRTVLRKQVRKEL